MKTSLQEAQVIRDGLLKVFSHSQLWLEADDVRVCMRLVVAENVTTGDLVEFNFSDEFPELARPLTCKMEDLPEYKGGALANIKAGHSSPFVIHGNTFVTVGKKEE